MINEGFLPKKIKKILFSLVPESLLLLCDKGEGMIQGGIFSSLFLRQKVNDIDIFIEDRSIFNEYVKKFNAVLEEDQCGASFVFNDHVIDLQWSCGLSLSEMLSLADLTVSQIGYTKKSLFFNENFFFHIKKRIFSLTGQTLSPEKTKERVKKYNKRMSYGSGYVDNKTGIRHFMGGKQVNESGGVIKDDSTTRLLSPTEEAVRAIAVKFKCSDEAAKVILNSGEALK